MGDMSVASIAAPESEKPGIVAKHARSSPPSERRTTVSKPSTYARVLVVANSNAATPIIIAKSFATKGRVVHVEMLFSMRSAVIAVVLPFTRRCPAEPNLRPAGSNAIVQRIAVIPR